MVSIAVLTVAEKIKKDSERAIKWEKENPGLSWCNSESPESEPKIYITKSLLGSKAYRSLSKNSMLIYQDMLGKKIMLQTKRNRKKVWVCTNNGEIIYPYSEAKEKGISSVQFRDAIDELQEKGLIDITHQGRGGRKPIVGTGDCTTYWIDDRWEDYGSDDFMQPRNPRRKDTRRDRGFASIWNDPERKESMLKKRQETLQRKRNNKI